jgi:hypothetical protein
MVYNFLYNNKTDMTKSPKISSRWRITLAVLSLFTLITKHHSLHQPEHVGMFAGSLLQRGDWDH